MLPPVDPSKPLDLVAIGSWTCFDHLLPVERLPAAGDTVRVTGPVTEVGKVSWGGCAQNNAAAAARLGLTCALVSVVGRDFRDSGYAAYFQELGVVLDGTIVVEDGLCGHSFLFSDPTGTAICLSHLGVSERQEEFAPSADVVGAARVAIVNYRFDRFTLDAARIAAAAGSTVVISGNLATAPKVARSFLAAAHVLVCTAHEACQLTRAIGGKRRDDLFALGLRAVVETEGRSGSVIFSANGDGVRIPAIPAEPVDPVGAGDAFAGGLASGVAMGLPIGEAARLGAAVASFVVEVTGCQTNLPSLEAAQRRLLR